MPQLGARISGELALKLQSRGGLSEVARQWIERSAYLLESDGRRIKAKFTEAERSCVASVLVGTYVDPVSIRHLDHEVEDALIDGVAEQWDVDGPALVEKLRALSYGEAWALVDMIGHRNLPVEAPE